MSSHKLFIYTNYFTFRRCWQDYIGGGLEALLENYETGKEVFEDISRWQTFCCFDLLQVTRSALSAFFYLCILFYLLQAEMRNVRMKKKRSSIILTNCYTTYDSSGICLRHLVFQYIKMSRLCFCFIISYTTTI